MIVEAPDIEKRISELEDELHQLKEDFADMTLSEEDLAAIKKARADERAGRLRDARELADELGR